MTCAPLPMLAHKVQDHQAEFPCYVQPKLDGVRCLVWMRDGALACTSRNGKNLHVPPCLSNLPSAVINELNNGLVLDGELYVHGMRFQTLVSMSKRRDHPLADSLEYHIYDSFYSYFDVISQEAFIDRRARLIGLFHDATHRGIEMVATEPCDTPDDLDAKHDALTKSGYEGSIIRDPTARYVPGRSIGLLKRKDFLDSEYEITDVREGEGKNAGTAVLTCRTTRGAEFTATAPGSYEEKAAALRQRDGYIGKMVTIKYQELTDSGIPRFPIATGFPL